MKILITFIIIFSLSIQAQQNNKGYDYPIKPGTQQWKALSSHIEMQNACQIPISILKSFTTNSLIETVLNYPLYGDIFAFDKLQEGFESVTSGFNGLQELLKREDRGTKLLEKYSDLNPAKIDQTWALEEKGAYAAKFYYLEILLAQNSILTSIKREQRILLLHTCIEKAKLKGEYPDVYGILSFANLGLLAGRILLIDNFSSFNSKVSENQELKIFLKDAILPDASLVNDILDQVVQYLKQNN